MDSKVKATTPGVATSPETAMASELFDQFVSAGTFKAVLVTYRQLCEVLRLKPTNIGTFFPRLKAKLHSWRAASLWAKLDKRASHKCYNRGKVCPNTRVLIIGGGPCGLRAAIEAQLLGAKVVVVEKRDRFSRNNVLHLWPFVIHDLRNLGAKKFFGKFCASSIDHISIRQLQVILLKISLLLGVEVHENVSFVSLKEPPEDQSLERIGWRACVSPADHPVSQYEFDVLIGADGKRNTLLGFNRKEFRGKLAIAVTANFINRHTMEEARVQEISGVAFIFNQKFFQDMREETGIDLENIVYYKDDTHYFVMTAKKQSLLDRGVIINDHNDTARLLSAENVDREALMEYARDAADFATNCQLPSLDFAVNHYGQADVAMFDFTSMYAAENACRITERRGHKLLQGLVGDSLLEPFWPTGSGCARGFLSSFDVAWMIRSWSSGKLSNLQVIAEREAIYRLLAQTTPENLSKDTNQYTLNPTSRYPNLNLHSVLPSQVRSLYDTDLQIDDQIIDIPVELPRKKRKRESVIHPDALLNWCQRQVALHENIKIENLSSSWKNGLALCAILHRYRPDLIDLESLKPEDSAKNNQLAFDICEKELGIPPVMTGQEMAECAVPDKLFMVSYLAQIYENFRGEIPVVRMQKSSTDDRAASPTRQSIGNPRSILTKISNKFQSRRKYSIEREAAKEKADSLKRGKHPLSIHKRRSKERDKGIALDFIKDVELTNYKISPTSAPKESINSRVKNLEMKMQRDAGLRCHLIEEETFKPSLRTDHTELNIKMIQEQLQKNGNSKCDKKPTSTPKVGRLRKDEWNVKMLEEKINQQQKSLPKSSGIEKSKILQDIFDNKLRLIDAKVRAGGALTMEEQEKFRRFDSNLNKLTEKLSKGNLDNGERGHNQVSAMTEHMRTIWNRKSGRKRDPLPPAPVGSPICLTDTASQSSVSETCYFCQKRVYLMERLSAEGLFFHRSCFKCEYCSASLRLGNYSFDKDNVCGGKFYCRPHFRMQKPDPRWQEMMKRKQAFLSAGFNEQKEKIYTTLLANTEKALSPNKFQDSKVSDATDSPSPVPSSQMPDSNLLQSQDSKSPKLLLEPLNIIGRDQTPERVEYENSILDYSEEELLTSELEEEELTQKNLGPCQDLITSDDDYSDFSTDSESDEEAYAEELERSLTADETRKLAETWQKRYSAERSLLADSDSSSDSSDTEIGTEDGTSDDINSDEEYSIDGSHEEDEPENENQPITKSPETKNDLIVEVPVISLKPKSEEETSDSEISEELSESEEGSGITESEDESEPELPLLPAQIPTIVIEESPPQNIDQDQEWVDLGEEDVQKAATSEINKENLSKYQALSSSSSSSSPSKNETNLSEVSKTDSEIGDVEQHTDPSSEALKAECHSNIIKQPIVKSEHSDQGMSLHAASEVTKKNNVIGKDEADMQIDLSSNTLKKIVCDDFDNVKIHTVNFVEATSKTCDSSNIPYQNNEQTVCVPQSPEIPLALITDSVIISIASEPLLNVVDQPVSGIFNIEKFDLKSTALLKETRNVKTEESSNRTEPIVPVSSNASNGKIESCNVPTVAAVSEEFQTSLLPVSEDVKLDNSNNKKVNNLKNSEPKAEIHNDDYKFNPSNITVRQKKTTNTNNDSFDWDSDKSITLPWFCDASDDFSVDLKPVDKLQTDASDSNASLLFTSAVSESFSGVQKHISPQEAKVVTGVCKTPISSELKCFAPKVVSPLEFYTPYAPKSSSTPKPVEKTNLTKETEKNKEPLTPISELHTKSFTSISPFSNCTTSSEKIWHQNKAYSPILPVKEKASDISVPSFIDVMSRSFTEQSSDNSALGFSTASSSEKVSKSSGYSGSFAEKIRPKSAMGDTIYLRSLDINLQKQLFPSITKSIDKLDELDCSTYKKRDSFLEMEDSVPDVQPAQHHAKREFKRQTSAPMEYSTNTLPTKSISPAVPVAKKYKMKELPSSAPLSAPLYDSSYGDLTSPYTYAQNRPVFENAFPTKMRPKCDMDLGKLRGKREKRRSVHENIQGLPFADEEKAVTPSDVPYNPDNVFNVPLAVTDGAMTPETEQEILARLDKSAAQEKARKEARARARLKSDEELGLSPKNYRKKYQRQLSLSSIYYEELNNDEFYDDNEVENELEVIDGTFHAKRVEIFEAQSELFDVGNSDSDRVSLNPCENHASDNNPPGENLDKQISSCQSGAPVASYPAPLPSKETSTECSTIPVQDITPTSSNKKSPDSSPDFMGAKSPFSLKLDCEKPNVESTGVDEEQMKSTNKKSFFSILNFGKGNVFKDKSAKNKVKSAERDRASSLPAEITIKNSSKQSPFSNLKLNKSKEKPKDKQRHRHHLTEPPEASVAGSSSSVTPRKMELVEESKSILLNPSQAKIIPKYTVYKNPGALFPVITSSQCAVPQSENGLASRATEHATVSDIDEKQRDKAARKSCETEPKQEIMEKEISQRVVQKVHKQQEMKRLRTAQEIQRRLEELEVEQKELEQLGVEVEKALRREEKEVRHGAESELMQEWYRLVHSKNILIREEQELLIRLKDLELEDRHSRLQQEMRERMAESDSPKNPVQLGEEKRILTEMLRIVEERDELVAMLEQLRIKEEKDDKNLCPPHLSKVVQRSNKKA